MEDAIDRTLIPQPGSLVNQPSATDRLDALLCQPSTAMDLLVQGRLPA
jgi:hypothetical protein